MAKKNQVTEAKIASLKEEIEKLRNENHNLKRKVKRMEERKAAEKAERLEAQAQRRPQGMEQTESPRKPCGQTSADTQKCSLKS